MLSITKRMDEISSEDYERLVDAFTKQAAVDFRQAGQSIEQQRSACCRYFKRGEIADLSRPELVDFHCVSSPSVLEMAGCSDETDWKARPKQARRNNMPSSICWLAKPERPKAGQQCSREQAVEDSMQPKWQIAVISHGTSDGS